MISLVNEIFMKPTASNISLFFKMLGQRTFSFLLVLSIWLMAFPNAWGEEIKDENMEVRELRKLVDHLKTRIEVLESQHEEHEKKNSRTHFPKRISGGNATNGSKTARKPLPSIRGLSNPPDDINFSFGGQIIIEAALNWPSNPAVSDNDLFPNTIPTTSVGESGQFAINARDTVKGRVNSYQCGGVKVYHSG